MALYLAGEVNDGPTRAAADGGGSRSAYWHSSRLVPLAVPRTILSGVGDTVACMTQHSQVPGPVGFCAKCVANGRRIQATTIVDGTSCCDTCTISSYAVSDVADVQHKLRLADDPGPQV